MEAIYRGVLAGALGGAIGAVVAWVVSKVLRRQPRWAPLIPTTFAVAAAAISRPPAPPDPAVMRLLDAQPMVQALKTYYPNEYRKLANEVGRNASAVHVSAAVDAVLGPVIVRQRAKADPQSAYALYEVSRDEGRALRTVDPAACAAFLDGRGDNGLMPRVATPAMLAKDHEAAAKMLAQTATTPAGAARAMTMDVLIKLGAEAISTIPEQEQDPAILVLREMREPRSIEEARATCDFELALADTILSRPRSVAGELIRALWAMK